MARLGDLEAPVVTGTRPTLRDGRRLNQAFIWTRETGPVSLHEKRYLPQEEGFWEAGWYDRGEPEFVTRRVGIPGGRRGGGSAEAAEPVVGALICTEIWFNRHARDYGEAGAHLLLCPRATLLPSTDKWIAGGRAAAVVSGAFCLSSNFGGPAGAQGRWGGAGWVVDPEEGDVLGVTSAEIPFLTLDIDLARAEAAKNSYPRYVQP
jgi:N-carbamoylputrescine amidase